MRTDDDSWDIETSVGATALGVAAMRAAETRRPDALFRDPYAESLVTAVGSPAWTRIGHGDIEGFDEAALRAMGPMISSLIARTCYLDAYCADAVADGIGQIVILASGLDARAYRLDWPSGTTVFELDLPTILEFKASALARVRSDVDRRDVPVDLRQDWPAALRDKGFDPSRPTAWLAEGLLRYLPAVAQDRLFDTVTTLSFSGSRIGTGYVPDIRDRIAKRGKEISERWRRLGLNVNWADLVYDGERNDATEYLAARGWQTTVHTTPELYAANGFEFPDAPSMVAFGDIRYVSAELP